MTPIVNRIRGIMPKSRFADGSATKTAPNHKSLSEMASTIAVTAASQKLPAEPRATVLRAQNQVTIR